MRRHVGPLWRDWKKVADTLGYDYHTTPKGVCAWGDGLAYSFSNMEIDQICDVTEDLHHLCLRVVNRVVGDERLLDLFGIPHGLRDYIRTIWGSIDQSSQYLLGRMDLAIGRDGRVKLLEYNADTPSTAIETAMVQWQWLKAMCPSKDQFNSLHEDLTARFKTLFDSRRGVPFTASSRKIWFAPYPDSLEDYRHCEYYAELARQVGFETQIVVLDHIGYRSDQQFVLGDTPIDILYKIYPWEMMVQDQFASVIPLTQTLFLEPIWKMILSNKALLPTLWDMYPNHPNLLRAQWTSNGMSSYVEKRIFSREGQNITIVKDGVEMARTGGRYDQYTPVYQEYLEIREYDGFVPVIGSWIVGDKPAGMIVRESAEMITRNTSACIPHYIE